MNLEKIAQALDFEIDDVIMLIEMFLQNAQESLEILEDGVKTDNFSKIKNAAHAIKGSAANLLLEEITDIASQIEQLAHNESSADYISLYKSLKNEIDSISKIEAIL